eukprot:CAMPEP_0203956750 /NCGR_PEP_ID=MMETSP0359-20131031/88898_1 /ASSEMBLY_ACC=CAM_ASM_000338 /TAXON_ID=268821 /ORGANISM="Scrippsiella Hangoei, Strain SHTV-5" /LENGTH=32 /DNA_ID= /DNA_START= /DNA_END= /DNA_ORIENTATION=
MPPAVEMVWAAEVTEFDEADGATPAVGPDALV